MLSSLQQSLPQLSKTVVTAARQAGKVVMEFYNNGFSVQWKDDNSPVTPADKEAEDIIVAVLRAETQDLPVVAEESAAAGNAPHLQDGESFWLVDPLDGTKEFIRHSKEFTVNIGLIVNRVPVLGVIFAPALKQLYMGWSGGPCMRDTDGDLVEIGCRKVPAAGAVAVSGRSHRHKEQGRHLPGQRPVAREMTVGAALKFCRIAEGEADIFACATPTCEWDTAAGHALLTAAGGSLTHPDGSAFLYGKSDYLNGHFLAMGQSDDSQP